MSDVQIFNSEEFGQIRTAGTPDEPLFCLVDLCKSLELDASQVVRRLDEGVVSKHPLQTAGGIQQVNFVNEDGLYDVILDSRKPEARKFRKWVTSEVLPAIRRSGQYQSPAVLEDVPQPKAVVFGGPVADVRASLEWMQGVKELMGLGRTAMAEMVRSEGRRLGLPVPSVPSVEAGREPLSVSAIIKKWGLTGLKVQEFNQAMVREGGIAVRNGRKVLTGWGLDYGENRHSEQHPDVVWPVYYEDCFTYLCDRLGIVLSYRSGNLPY